MNLIDMPKAAISEHDRIKELSRILENELVTPVYQPIVDLGSGEIYGYEGLVRGPEGSPLHTPACLFDAANRVGVLPELEWICLRKVVSRFPELSQSQRLFVNVSPQTVAPASREKLGLLRMLEEAGDVRGRIVIELTEHEMIRNVESFRDAMTTMRALGFRIALDDLGEGFSGLRLWSEINPDYVKIDMHFVRGVHGSALKFQFLKSLQQIAENCGASLVAEGIEERADLNVIRDLGIRFGQGFLFSPPAASPCTEVRDVARQALRERQIAVYPESKTLIGRAVTAERLLIEVAPVSPRAINDEVWQRFESDAMLQILPVVENDIPVGIISRHQFVAHYAQPYRKELYGRRPCTVLMDRQPLVVEKNLSIHELSQIISSVDPRHLSEGFIITHHGCYAGLGSAQDLMRVVTSLQLEAARYANPLTLLPGNVPIDAHVERLLDTAMPFTVCYGDLNHFKSFNDAYGYRRGDEMIKLTSATLARVCDPRRDFLGHIGGDDFIALFQSEDWEHRCRRALEIFSKDAIACFDHADLARGTLQGEDRHGKTLSFPLTSLALGIVMISPGDYSGHLDISMVATEAKRQAKRIGGNALFIERRRPASSREAVEHNAPVAASALKISAAAVIRV